MLKGSGGEFYKMKRLVEIHTNEDAVKLNCILKDSTMIDFMYISQINN